MHAQTRLFMCLKDNFGVLLHDPGSGRTAAIDAPEAAPVEAALKATGWTLTDILVTHHHRDHTDGIAELKARYRCRVVAPNGEAGTIPDVDETVREGDTVRVGALEGRVIETPGHTSAPATLYFPADKLLFAGDTLFSIGCGRVIEGSMDQMWHSMLKLRALPDDTMLYCGHEYTLANIRFAKTVEPDNKALAAREQQVTKLLAAGKLTAPSPMSEEKAANPFLRADLPEVAKAVGLAGAPAAEVFAEIRTRKNKFLMQLSAGEIVRLLGLKPHPEGGHYLETHRDARTADRAASTAIYYLLARGERSHWHRVDATEVWHYYAGSALRLEIATSDDGPVERVTLGLDIAAGERPQAVVPAHAWQAAESLGDWTLVGCTVAPGFEFQGFELAPKGWSPGARLKF